MYFDFFNRTTMINDNVFCDYNKSDKNNLLCITRRLDLQPIRKLTKRRQVTRQVNSRLKLKVHQHMKNQKAWARKKVKEQTPMVSALVFVTIYYYTKNVTNNFFFHGFKEDEEDYFDDYFDAESGNDDETSGDNPSTDKGNDKIENTKFSAELRS